MRRMLLASAAVFALSGPAYAQVGTCTTAGGLPCASLTEQGIQYAEQIVQEAQEAITAVQEVTNTISLTDTVFNDLTNTVQQIMTTAQQASMLIGLSGQMLAGIQTPGGYPIGYGADTLQWHQFTINEANAVGNAMQVSGQVLSYLTTLSNDTATLAQLVNQIMAAVGRQQSLQSLQSALAQMAQTLHRTQATQTTNQQAALTYFMAQQDHKYMLHTENDHDLEGTWVNECIAMQALGAPPGNNC